MKTENKRKVSNQKIALHFIESGIFIFENQKLEIYRTKKAAQIEY